MDKKKLTPSLRFKGFTNTWEQRDVGDCLVSIPSKNFITEAKPSGKYPVYQQGDIPLAGYSDISPFRQENVILFGDHTLSLYRPEKPFLLATDGIKILKSNNFNNLFFKYYLEKYKPKSEGYKRHYSILIKKASYYTKSKTEQEKIGSIINYLDTLITLHQRKYEELQNAKKSLLQKMFPENNNDKPSLRFKGFTDAWEQRNLGSLGKTTSGVGFPDNEQGGLDGIPFYKVSDMNTLGNERELQVANNYVNDHQIQKHGWKPITETSIFFAKVGAAVMLNRKRLVKKPFLLDNNTMAYSFNSEWNIDFGFACFEKIDLTKLIQVGALPSFNGSDVQEIEIYLPEIKEQEKVGSLFSDLDFLITLHQCEYEKLQNIKKSLLERMFI